MYNNIKNEKYQGQETSFIGSQKTSFLGIILEGKPVKVLVAKPGNVTSLHLGTALSEIELRHLETEIDYCESAVNLICALEESSYEMIFIDYNLDHIDLCALLTFVRSENPKTRVVVTSAPVWSEQGEKEKVTSLCSSCCHEDFFDLDVESFIRSSQKLRGLV